MILAGITATSLYWISFTYGYTTAAVALGREHSVEFFASPESVIPILTLPLLPWAILGLKLLRLEALTLKVWYRMIPALRVLLGKLSIRNTLAHDPIPEFRFVPAHLPVLPFLSRSILSTFFLPFISSSIGWALSYALGSMSTLKRTLLVGLGMSYLLLVIVIVVVSDDVFGFRVVWVILWSALHSRYALSIGEGSWRREVNDSLQLYFIFCFVVHTMICHQDYYKAEVTSQLTSCMMLDTILGGRSCCGCGRGAFFLKRTCFLLNMGREEG